MMITELEGAFNMHVNCCRRVLAASQGSTLTPVSTRLSEIDRYYVTGQIFQENTIQGDFSWKSKARRRWYHEFHEMLNGKFATLKCVNAKD